MGGSLRWRVATDVLVERFWLVHTWYHLDRLLDFSLSHTKKHDDKTSPLVQLSSASSKKCVCNRRILMFLLMPFLIKAVSTLINRTQHTYSYKIQTSWEGRDSIVWKCGLMEHFLFFMFAGYECYKSTKYKRYLFARSTNLWFVLQYDCFFSQTWSKFNCNYWDLRLPDIISLAHICL